MPLAIQWSEKFKTVHQPEYPLKKIGRTLAAVGAGLTLNRFGGQAQTWVQVPAAPATSSSSALRGRWLTSDATHITLQLNNTSQNAPASNTNSACYPDCDRQRRARGSTRA
jgi:hypothetical protein